MKKVVISKKVVILIEQGKTQVNVENLLKTLNVGDMKCRILSEEEISINPVK